MGRCCLRIGQLCVPVALLLLADSALSEAQQPNPLTVEAALSTRSFSHVSPIVFSRDGKWLAYTVRNNERVRLRHGVGIGKELYVRTGIMTEDEATDIWVSDVETGQSRNLTHERYSNWNPSWSPNGRYLGFLSDRDGGGQARLWIWDSAKDELRMVANVNVRSAYLSPGIQWTADSRSALVTIVPQALSLSEYVRKVLFPAYPIKPPSEEVSGATAIVYQAHRTNPGDSPAARSSRANLDAYSLSDLVRIEIAAGKITTIASGRRIAWYAASPNGLYVAYAVPKRLHPEGGFRKEFDLAVMDLKTGQEHLLLSDGLLADVFAWSPDGAFLVYGLYESEGAHFFAASSEKWESKSVAVLPRPPAPFEVPVWNASGSCFYILLDGALWRISLSASDARELARISGRRIVRRLAEPTGILWPAIDGGATVVLTQDEAGKQSGFYRTELETGRSIKLVEDGHCYDCNALGSGLGLRMVAAAGSKVAYVAEDARHAPDLWVSDPDFRFPRRLTHLNPQFDDCVMGTTELVDWLGGDGQHLQGAVLLPSNYRKGEKYPLLVFVYPTLLSNEFDRFGFGNYPGPFNVQLFATRGYVVLLPDVREDRHGGSSGITKSVLTGINKMVEMGVADPQRVGIMGHSMGGYATLSLLVQTDRFKAAVEAAGFADYVGLFGQLDVDGASWSADEVQRSMGAFPWQDPLRYVSNSPIYFLDHIAAPLLIVQGSQDESVSSFAGDQVFVGMRALGREVEYAKYEGESHEPHNWDYANQRDLCLRVLEWFGTHLKPGE